MNNSHRIITISFRLYKTLSFRVYATRIDLYLAWSKNFAWQPEIGHNRHYPTHPGTQTGARARLKRVKWSSIWYNAHRAKKDAIKIAAGFRLPAYDVFAALAGILSRIHGRWDVRALYAAIANR